MAEADDEAAATADATVSATEDDAPVAAVDDAVADDPSPAAEQMLAMALNQVETSALSPLW